MAMLPSFRLAAVLLACAGSACILQTTTPGGELATLRAEQRAQADRVATALCASYYACGCEERFPAHETEPECVELVSDQLVARLEQGIDGGLDYDPGCLDAQAELAEALGCATSDDLPAGSELAVLVDAAERCFTYHGPIEAGQECEPLLTARGHDCEPGLRCDDFQVCVDATPLERGEPCDNEWIGCAVGLVCAHSVDVGFSMCTSFAALGETCAEFGVCTFDTWCDPIDAICKALPVAGEPCQSHDPPCAPGSVCELGVCTEAAAEDEPCSPGCGPGLECGDQSTCIPRRAIVCDLSDSLP